MTKNFRIEIINKNIIVCVGDEGLDFYKNICKENNQSFNFNTFTNGSCLGLFCWIKDKKDRRTLFHELFHLIENLSDIMGIKYENEFRAYITGYVYEMVLDWFEKIK